MGLYIGNNKYKVMIGNQKCSFVTEDKVLPYDAEIEYLQSTGTQYINTGIIPGNKKLCADLIFSYTSINPDNMCIFGSYKTDGVDNFMLSSFTYKFRIKINDYGYFGNDTDTSTHHVILNGSNGTKFDNINVNSVQYKIPLSNNVSIPLFRRSDGCFSLSRIYYIRFYDDGILIRDFIPVRVGNVGYMYDKVSGQLFGNAGTGNFILGPDK